MADKKDVLDWITNMFGGLMFPSGWMESDDEKESGALKELLENIWDWAGYNEGGMSPVTDSNWMDPATSAWNQQEIQNALAAAGYQGDSSWGSYNVGGGSGGGGGSGYTASTNISPVTTAEGQAEANITTPEANYGGAQSSTAPPQITMPEAAPGSSTAAPTIPGQVTAPAAPTAAAALPGAVAAPAGPTAPGAVALPDAPKVDLAQFQQLIDTLDFSSISIGGGGGGIAPAVNVGNIEARLSQQWSGMWANVNAEIDAQEQREIQTLTEIVMTDWGDQWQHGIASLDARGLASPEESTTSDYWQKKWTGERDQALVQGIRDIQNKASDRRLEWTKFGMEMQSDWAKFDVSSALEARSQDVTMRGQDIQAGIASAELGAKLKMFGIETALDLQKFGVQTALTTRGQDLDFMNAQANREQSWAETLYSGGVTQRGQDISFMNAQADREQDWASTLYQGQVSQRGQDIDYASNLLSSQDRQAALKQEWAQFLGTLASTQRGQDMNYDINKQQLQQGLTIAGMESDAADQANIWGAAGNIIGSEWWNDLWSDIWK